MSIVGGGALGQYPDGGGGGPASVASPIDVLSEDPNAFPIYLLIATPWDPGAGAETSIYYSTAEFRSAVSDTPSDQPFTVDKLAVPLDIRNSLGISPRGRLEASGATAGDMVFTTQDPDNRSDELVDYHWDGRDVTVLVGLEGYTLAQCAEVFSGTAEGARWGDKQISIYCRSPRFKLERPIQTTTYAGTGAAEGGDEIKGRYKPLVFGQVRQWAPVLINGTSLVYQAHDGSIEAVNAVRDRGVALAFDADYADYAALIAASIAGGEYGTCLAEGLIRLGATPSGVVTMDLQGDNSGTGYVATAATIIRRVVTTYGPFTDPDDLDVGSLTDLEADNSAVLGIGTRLQETEIAAVVDSLAGSVGAFIDFTRSGRLRVARLIDPSTATATDTITDVVAESFKGANADVPAHTVKLGYRRYWQTLSGEEVATSVDDDTRFDYGEDYRFPVPSEDATILTAHPSAKIYDEVVSLLDLESAASTEQNRLLALFKPTRHTYEVDAYGKLFQYKLGDIVTFQVPRYDLVSGKKFVVLGFTEAPVINSNVPHENIVGLILWGRED